MYLLEESYQMRNLNIALLIFYSLSCLGMEVKVWNVGQGNCIFIADSSKSEFIVADAGSTQLPGPNAKGLIISKIVEVITSSPIENKKLIILVTHAHADHYNWLREIIERLLPVKELSISVFLGGSPKDYGNFAAYLEARKIA
jgi:beta-lactamase superfamily II metal-dependent hydrolase